MYGAEYTTCPEAKFTNLHLNIKLSVNNPVWQLVKSFLSQDGLIGFHLHTNTEWLIGSDPLGEGVVHEGWETFSFFLFFKRKNGIIN